MTLNRRIRLLEAIVKPEPIGCHPAVLILRYEDTDKSESCGPSHEEIEEHVKHLNDSGQCLGCRGSCAIDWGPDGFTNHQFTGDHSSSSGLPKMFIISVTSERARELTRRLLNGEGTE
jgi:hypothetical protein